MRHLQEINRFSANEYTANQNFPIITAKSKTYFIREDF